MSLENARIGRQELRYFGKVSASISHELKNVLAILNEYAGLLQDMADQGHAPDVDRIRRLAATMLAQIGRGDRIIKRMNRFAHSVDQDCARVDLGGLLVMVVELFARSAATRGVTVEVQTGVQSIMIATCPFVLETLLGSLLDRLTAATPGIGTLNIELALQGSAAQVRMHGLTQHADVVAGVLETEEFKVLLAALQASAGFSRESDALFITLPDDLEV